MNAIDLYMWDDGEGYIDVQSADAFQNTSNGWKAEYDAAHNEWLVTTPYTHSVRRYQALR